MKHFGVNNPQNSHFSLLGMAFAAVLPIFSALRWGGHSSCSLFLQILHFWGGKAGIHSPCLVYPIPGGSELPNGSSDLETAQAGSCWAGILGIGMVAPFHGACHPPAPSPALHHIWIFPILELSAPTGSSQLQKCWFPRRWHQENQVFILFLFLFFCKAFPALLPAGFAGLAEPLCAPKPPWAEFAPQMIPHVGQAGYRNFLFQGNNSSSKFQKFRNFLCLLPQNPKIVKAGKDQVQPSSPCFIFDDSSQQCFISKCCLLKLGLKSSLEGSTLKSCRFWIWDCSD